MKPLADLKQARTLRAELNREADRRIAAMVERARAERETFTACAEAAGMTRQSLYELIERAGRD